MNYLHYEFDAVSDDVIEVTLDKQANVRLLDNTNYQNYQRGEQHRYYGGLVRESPLRLKAPKSGHWHLVVDLGGYAGTVRASIQVLSHAGG